MQAWGVLEAQQGNIDLARQLFKCAVKADPTSEKSWLVRRELSPLCRSECHVRVMCLWSCYPCYWHLRASAVLGKPSLCTHDL